MEVKTVVTGYLDENCYLLIQNGTCLVVDPGDDFNKIRAEIGDNKVLGVLITHSHFDHIGALRNFLTKRSIKIFKRSKGRTDLPGGSDVEMKNSLEKLKEYPSNITLYPGHNEITTLKYEKENNPFLM